jgi:hypothetical protein
MIFPSFLVARGRTPFLILGAVLLAFFMGSAIVLGPVRNRTRQLDESIIAQEKKAARNLRVLSEASKQAAIREYEKFGGIILMRASTAEENAAMLTEIERLAADGKVVVSSTKPHEPKIDKDFEEYQVELEIEAGMPQLVSFVYGIENSTQLLRIEKLTLYVKGDGAGDVLRGSLLVSKVVTR